MSAALPSTPLKATWLQVVWAQEEELSRSCAVADLKLKLEPHCGFASKAVGVSGGCEPF